jgi:hypothetical protein
MGVKYLGFHGVWFLFGCTNCVNWYTRRNFIKRAVAATGTLGFATGCRRLRVTNRNDLSRVAIDRLRAKLKGRLILPSDPSYEIARRVFYWNAGTERRPRVIVQCAREEDALQAVEFARRHALEVAARAGGHSHLGWGCSNGLVIDLSGMKRIAIDPLRRTARAEGGVLSGEVARTAGRHGLAPVLGQCPGVGASGVIRFDCRSDISLHWRSIQNKTPQFTALEAFFTPDFWP